MCDRSVTHGTTSERVVFLQILDVRTFPIFALLVAYGSISFIRITVSAEGTVARRTVDDLRFRKRRNSLNDRSAVGQWTHDTCTVRQSRSPYDCCRDWSCTPVSSLLDASSSYRHRDEANREGGTAYSPRSSAFQTALSARRTLYS